MLLTEPGKKDALVLDSMVWTACEYRSKCGRYTIELNSRDGWELTWFDNDKQPHLFDRPFSSFDDADLVARAHAAYRSVLDGVPKS